jgi:50S ribosomal protein L16 3-hydroxylase
VKPTFLGGLGAKQFLRDYWQKRPLLIDNAFANFAEPFRARDILQLACRDDAESRLVRHENRRWLLEHGPFSAARFKRLPAKNWTLLVQDTQHFSAAAKALLQQFSFIPHARVDDLMVSLAKPGGGVGPHVDSYDVFLLQGAGRRRWRISAARDLALVPDAPLKILARFKPEQEWVLETGDMLYLPPGYAHHGVALDDCITYSIGFRAPSTHELGTAFLDFLRDEIQLQGQFGDPDLRPQKHPGEIPLAMRRDLMRTLKGVRWDDLLVERFIGCYLSEPKPSVFFAAPADPLARREFQGRCRARGVSLDARTRLLFSGRRFFINGAAAAVPEAALTLFTELADRQRLNGFATTARAFALLYDWYLHGYLHPNP